MDVLLNWRTWIGVGLVYYGGLVLYRLLLHPLARFPGSKLAAISRWYEAYFDIILGGQYTTQIAELHKKYGPIVRISPHELHVIDPAFFDTLYRLNGHWDKYAWTYDAFGAKSSTIFGSKHDAHRARRQAIAPFFSKTNVIAQQDLLSRNMDKLCRRISQLMGETFNLGAAISAFTRDTANEFIVGRKYDELSLDDFGIGLSIASSGAGVFWRTTKHVRWFGPALRSVPVDWVMKTADEGTKSFLRYLQQSETDTKNTLAKATSSSSDKNKPTTLVHAIVDSDLPPAEKSFDRVFEEIATVTGAAFETTANTLRLIFYHIYTDDSILTRLRNEIATIIQSPDTPLTIKQLETLPFLTAVLKEGLRLSPAIATRMARITDKDLLYDKWRIPAGTPVGMTTLLMHTDEKLYPAPMRFDPDRWMHSTTQIANSSFFAPFSRGTRMCLGMHLAYAEMYMIVAALVQRFTFTIQGVTPRDFEFERDDFGIGTRAGCNLVVGVASYKG